jgi:hypothetical protein
MRRTQKSANRHSEGNGSPLHEAYFGKQQECTNHQTSALYQPTSCMRCTAIFLPDSTRVDPVNQQASTSLGLVDWVVTAEPSCWTNTHYRVPRLICTLHLLQNTRVSAEICGLGLSQLLKKRCMEQTSGEPFIITTRVCLAICDTVGHLGKRNLWVAGSISISREYPGNLMVVGHKARFIYKIVWYIR